MQSMFNVRFTRALLSACTVEAFLHAARAAAAAPTPSQTACRLSYYASFFTWQRASAFNQPLSLDTSSVTTMQYMFNVRFTRALPSAPTVGAVQHAACAAAAGPTPSQPACRPSYYPFLLGSGRRRSTSR